MAKKKVNINNFGQNTRQTNQVNANKHWAKHPSNQVNANKHISDEFLSTTDFNVKEP